MPDDNNTAAKKEATSDDRVNGTDARQKRTYEKPLAIRGTLDDVLRAAMSVKPKDQQMKTNQP